MQFTFPCKIANSGKPLLDFFSRWFIHPYGLRSVATSSCVPKRYKENISASSMEHQHCSPSLRMMSSSENFASNSFTQYSVQSGTGSVQPVSGYTMDVPAVPAGDIQAKWKSHINYNQVLP